MEEYNVKNKHQALTNVSAIDPREVPPCSLLPAEWVHGKSNLVKSRPHIVDQSESPQLPTFSRAQPRDEDFMQKEFHLVEILCIC